MEPVSISLVHGPVAGDASTVARAVPGRLEWTMNMNRHDFLGIMLAAAAAPAIVRAESIMRLVVPRSLILWGDGIHDDTAALRAFFNGGLIYRPSGLPAQPTLYGERFLITESIRLHENKGRIIINSCIQWRGMALQCSPPMFLFDAGFTSPPPLKDSYLEYGSVSQA